MREKQVENPRVLFISGIGGDTRRFRCFHPQEQLAMQGMESELRESDDPQLLVDVLDYDVFVLHRVPYNRLVATVIDIARMRGKPVVFETDDLVFDPALYEHIGFVDTLSAEEARRYRSDLGRLAKTFRQCDCVLTTTGFLAEEARRRGKPAYVHRNAPSDEMVQIAEQAFASRRRLLEQKEGERPLVIGYISGTGSHNRDFAVIAKPLIWALETYPNVYLHITGHLSLGPEFSPFLTRIRRTPYVVWREVLHVIARLDVNLAPLEEDNPFCQAKSEVKFMEAGMVGVPTIASRIEAHEYAIADGKDGLLASSPEEWRNALQMLLDSPEKRREIGEAARRTVYARYTPEQRATELVQTLQGIIRQHGGSTAAPECILREFAAGVERYASQLRTDAGNQEDCIASLRKMTVKYEDQLAELSRLVEERERRIEAIMQGRVMRLMTGTQLWWRRIRGRG